MKNRFFNERVLPVLLRIQSWRLACSAYADRHPAASPRHRRWMMTHQHAHSHLEVMIALEGKTVYGINHRIYPCDPGSVFVFDPDMPHDQGYPPWTPAITHLWIAFLHDKAIARLGSTLRGRSRVQCNIPFLFDLDDSVLWRQGASAACAPGQHPDLIHLRLLTALANVVAALVEAGYRETTSTSLARFHEEKIAAICRHIRETGGGDASLDHLAQVSGYSKFHFLRLFRQHTGQSVHEYVNQSRLRKVGALLARGLALKAIAAELGFSCPAAFSRWYRSFQDRAREVDT